MQKKSFIVFIILISYVSSYAQTNWPAIEDVLNYQRETHKISDSEWYAKLKKDTGHFDRLSLWVISEETLSKSKPDNKIRIYFPDKFQVVMPNGNKYAKVYLENNTADSIDISRIDATLANVQEYFLIKDKWIAFRKNGTSTCGNSYFTNKLAPNKQLNLELSNNGLIEGKNKVSYKISILLENHLVESNVIQVHLYDSQLKRMSKSVVTSK